ncbi:MAG: hypothetical protein V2I33_07105 [Kangiellaceae bacterium]|jgi:hypothetical protein|nr:hypothetical protein [Kangiellaceae bacterium]
MALDKDKVIELAKNRGMDIGEDVAEQLAKSGANLLLDLLQEVADQTENKYDDVALAAVMTLARKMADEIDVSL